MVPSSIEKFKAGIEEYSLISDASVMQLLTIEYKVERFSATTQTEPADIMALLIDLYKSGLTVDGTIVLLSLYTQAPIELLRYVLSARSQY